MPHKDFLPNFSSDDGLDALLRYFGSVMASVPDAMIVIDEAGVISAFSRTAEDLFGYAANEVIGKNVSMLMSGADAAHHDTYISNFLESRIPKIIGIGRIVSAKRKDGEIVPVELKIGEARIQGKSVFTGFLRDLTEQRRAEYRLSQLQTELTHYSRLSAVGTMASALAHELSQPLTSLTNYIETVRDMLAGDPAEFDAVLAHDALDQAAKLAVLAGQVVRQIRDFVSRGEVHVQPIALAPLIQEARALALIGRKGRKTAWLLNLPEVIPNVYADPIQIQQVLINLMQNALDALSDTDAPKIEIHAEIDAPSNMVALTISDNGPGLSPEIQAQIFRPFHSSKESGMGLGLSICKTIIEASGGYITHFTPPNGGCAFRFTLPISEIEKEPSSNV